MAVTQQTDLIIFQVAGVHCALGCLDIQEIIRTAKGIIPIKGSSRAVKGILNLRGEIVTVLNLIQIFDLDASKETQEMIIVTSYKGESIGLLVNEVQDVVQNEAYRHEKIGTIPHGLKNEFFTGVIERQGLLIPLLELDAVMEADVIFNTDETSQAVKPVDGKLNA